jgi:hypothetical protein
MRKNGHDTSADGGKEKDIGDLSTAFNTGLTIGAFTWGLLVDILGVSPLHQSDYHLLTDKRKWCFNITCIFASVFGFLFAGKSSFL